MHKKIFKLASLLFITISIQSCKVYDTDALSEYEAVASAKKVKVITTDGETYKFEKLLVEEEQLIGLSKSNSNAAIYPSEKVVDSKGRTMEKVSIDRATIKEINVYDKKKSKKRTIWLTVGITFGTLIVLSAAAATVVVIAGA